MKVFQPLVWESVFEIMSKKTKEMETVEDLRDQLHDLRLDFAELKKENQTLQKEIEVAEQKFWGLSAKKADTADESKWKDALCKQAEARDAEKTALQTKLVEAQTLASNNRVFLDKCEKVMTVYREKFLQALSIANFVSNGSIAYLTDTPEGKKLLQWSDKELEEESKTIMKGK